MKKIKSLFKLIPAFFLAFFSGLGVLIDTKEKTIDSTYADTSVLVFSRSVTNYHLDFNDNRTSGLSWDMYFDFEISFYQDISQNDFYFVLNTVYKYTDWSFTYAGVTKNISADGNRTETLVSSRVTSNLTEFNLPLNFNISYIISDDSSFYYGNLFGKWSWISAYRICYTLVFPTNSGVTPNSVILLSPSSTEYTFIGASWSNQPSGFNPNAGSPRLTSTKLVGTYDVDFNRSNYDTGFSDGYSSGYNDGFNVGYESGYSSGNSSGYDNGYRDGVASQEQAIQDAFSSGYSAGFNDGYVVDGTVATIFSGILQVGMLPINILLAIFNFEILGINLSAFISAILTVCLTVIVIRALKGGGNSD